MKQLTAGVCVRFHNWDVGFVHDLIPNLNYWDRGCVKFTNILWADCGRLWFQNKKNTDVANES